jgi:outer membrane protein, heavy metal efflux system
MRRVLVLLFLLTAPRAFAQAPQPGPATPSVPSAPPLAELVAEALAKAPALAALRSGVAASRAMERPAAALPDPMVEAMLQDADFPRYTLGEEEMSMAGVEVRQGMPFPGKRRARTEAARAETDRRAAEAEALARRIAAEVRTLYARVYANDREREALTAAREVVDLLSATASSRYATGESDQESILKAQLQLSRLEERLEDLRGERAGMVADLNRWLDRPGVSPLGEVKALPPVAPPPSGGWEAAAVAGSSEARIARAAIAAAEKKLAVARLDLKPDFAPSAGLASRGSFGPVLTLRFGVELPFWKREKQEPMIQAAEAELEQAKAELRDAEAMARTAAARAAAEYERADRQIVRFREGIVPQTSTALGAARSSYLTGRGDFSTVAEDFNLWLEARMQLARREADRFAAWAELAKLTGEGEQP